MFFNILFQTKLCQANIQVIGTIDMKYVHWYEIHLIFNLNCHCHLIGHTSGKFKIELKCQFTQFLTHNPSTDVRQRVFCWINGWNIWTVTTRAHIALWLVSVLWAIEDHVSLERNLINSNIYSAPRIHFYIQQGDFLSLLPFFTRKRKLHI